MTNGALSVEALPHRCIFASSSELRAAAVRVFLLLALVVMTAPCQAADLLLGPPVASGGPLEAKPGAFRMALTSLGGAKVQLRTADRSGSQGLVWSTSLDQREQYVLVVNTSVKVGRWSVRIDAGSDASAKWFGLGAGDLVQRFRVLGTRDLRVFVFSDDPGAEAWLCELEVRSSGGADDLDIPLVWPPVGELGLEEVRRQRARWGPLIGWTEQDSPMKTARSIANLVYQRSNVTGPSGPTFSGFSGPDAWTGMPTRTIDGLCGTFSAAMVELCGKFGISARVVAMGSRKFVEGQDSGGTHELVEVFDPAGRRWILLDPTFGLAFESADGRSLGVSELSALASGGGTWREVPIATLRSGRTIGDYYLSFKDLLFIADAPKVDGLGEAGAAYRSRDRTVKEVFRERYGVEPAHKAHD